MAITHTSAASPPVPHGGSTRTAPRDGLAVGHAFVEAITAGDGDRIEALLAPDVRFRALTPRTERAASTAHDARGIIDGWFGDTSARRLADAQVGRVGARTTIVFRLDLLKAGEPRTIEQHATATVVDGLVTDLALVCSGFQPGAGTASRIAAPDASATAAEARLDAVGLTCATLTPTIRSAVLGLDPGAVLEIVTDDPEAEEGLRSWSRLTGNELLDPGPATGTTRTYMIRRTPKPPAGGSDGGTHR